MAERLTSSDRDFERAFASFLTRKREVSEDVDASVRSIIADVRARGDAALIALTAKFDQLDVTAATLRVSTAEIDAAVAACPADTLDALRFAHDRI